MREAASVSPFAAPTREARQARWLLWQKQSVEHDGTYHASDGGGYAAPDRSPAPPPEPPLTAAAALQHHRYDAVVQRMQQARKQAGAYSAWS